MFSLGFRQVLMAACLAVVITGISGCAVSTGGAAANDVEEVAVQRLTGTITEVGREFGNLDSDIPESAINAAGISKGDRVRFECNGRTFDVTVGTTYADVARGEWIAFINWDSKLRFARSFANAAETSGCKKDDLISVTQQS